MATTMLVLQPSRLSRVSIPLGTAWLLAACAEAKGKQDLWTRQKPEVLAALRQRAIIQSAESSNRIEGVTVEPKRLHPVVLGKARPLDRSEEELAGYRRALDWIFRRKGHVRMTTGVVRKLHAMAQGGSTGDAGQWRTRNSEIVEILPTGARNVRFVPATAKQTPRMIEELCRNYNAATDEEIIPPLLSVATFVFDFLCIRPFRDGNGRVSRLLTALLLQSHDFQVVRFVSLERLIEQSKDDYYRVLRECSQGWRDGRGEIIPWWNYFLGIVRSAYRELEEQIASAAARPAKTDMIRRAVLEQAGEFNLAGLAAELPGVSRQLIKRVLSELKSEGLVQLKGRGRGAIWSLTP